MELNKVKIIAKAKSTGLCRLTRGGGGIYAYAKISILPTENENKNVIWSTEKISASEKFKAIVSKTISQFFELNNFNFCNDIYIEEIRCHPVETSSIAISHATKEALKESLRKSTLFLKEEFQSEKYKLIIESDLSNLSTKVFIEDSSASGVSLIKQLENENLQKAKRKLKEELDDLIAYSGFKSYSEHREELEKKATPIFKSLKSR